MDNLEDNLIEFSEEDALTVRKKYGLDKQERMDEAVQLLQEWLTKQTHFLNTDKMPRRVLEVSLINNKGSIERVKYRLTNLLTYKTTSPQYFVTSEDDLVKQFGDLGIVRCAVSPKVDDNLCRYIVIKGCSGKINGEHYMNFYRFILAVIEYLSVRDYSELHVLVLDGTDVKVAEAVAALNFTEMRTFVRILTECYSLRLRSVHLVVKEGVAGKLVDLAAGIIRGVLPGKLRRRLQLHRSVAALAAALPRDYVAGGADSVSDIHDRWVKAVSGKKYRKFLIETQDIKLDAAYINREEFCQQGMAGSFRRLELD